MGKVGGSRSSHTMRHFQEGQPSFAAVTALLTPAAHLSCRWSHMLNARTVTVGSLLSSVLVRHLTRTHKRTSHLEQVSGDPPTALLCYYNADVVWFLLCCK